LIDIQSTRRDADISVVCVFNKPDLLPDRTDIKLNIEYIYGSNINREFSAWREGWEYIHEAVKDNSLVILANDTITKNQPYRYCIDFSISRFLVKLKSFNAQDPFVCGITENLNMESISKYITSFFLAMNAAAARMILNDIDDLSDYNCIKLDENLFSPNLFAPPKNKYSIYIEKWLTMPGLRGWYKAAPLTKNNKLEILGKAKCIMLEHRIAHVANEKNIQILDLFEFSGAKFLRYIYRLRQLLKFYVRQAEIFFNK
jgi:hypothetical protein